MKPPLSDWKPLRAVSSIAVESWGFAASSARRRMISAAVRPASESRVGVASRPAAGSSTTLPPAEDTSELIHTM